MGNHTSTEARAAGALAEIFAPMALRAADLAEFEDAAIAAGHAAIAAAMAIALEALDAELCRSLPEGARVHDRRERTLATEVGDVTFPQRRCRSAAGDFYPLSDRLGIPWGSRISPGARSFLVQAASVVSYERSARLLARRGSSVSKSAVMGCMRAAGALCAEEDAAAALALFRDGELPDAEGEAAELCVEADGTWFSLQRPGDGPRRCEVKAMVAYAGKEERGGRARRVAPVRHALVGPAAELWAEAVPKMGARWDLSKIERVDLGGDGEPWCAGLGAFLPAGEARFHLDPFHVNRAVMSCFAGDKGLARCVVGMIADGDVGPALAAMRCALDLGLADGARAAEAVAYLERHRDSIGAEGPSLGTMEPENQHVYGARMDSVPCGWSARGASDMARVLSRGFSGSPVPQPTRESSASPRRRSRDAARELAALGRAGLPASAVLKSPGRGYEAPHRASVSRMSSEVAFAAAVDGGMAF